MAVACLALLATPLLIGLADRQASDAEEATGMTPEQAAEALRIATGREILAESLGPGLSSLLAPALATPGGPASQSSLGALLGGAGADGRPRLPVPEAPAGPDPLLHALESYGAAVGQPIPPAPALRPAIAALRLDPEAESALARLVLAYTQALHLQAAATAALDPLERAVLQGDGAAMASWSRGMDAAALDAAVLDLAARVDQGQFLQAGDLLARTVEEVRVPLSRPARHPGPGSSPAELADPDPWGTTRAVVSVLRGGEPSPEPRPSASLDEALRGLLEAYGASPARLGGAPVALPASLDQAIASLVDAQAQGLRSGDAGAQAAAILAATEASQPTLRAWGALLQPGADAAPTDRLALLSGLLTPAPSPAALAASSMGVPAPAPLHVPPLGTLLERAGLPAADATFAAASLPPHVAAALAVVLAAQADLERAQGALTQGLPADQAWAVAATPAVAGLLRERTWTAQEAGLVQDWAEGLAALDADALRQLREAQVGAVRAVEAAVALLAPPAPAAPRAPAASVAGVDIPTGMATELAPCIDSDFSKCDEDVYLVLDVGGGILVTGEGSTLVDARFFGGRRMAQITIDLGGDDLYLNPAGAAQVGLGFANVTVGANNITPPFNQENSRTAQAAGGGILGVSVDVGGDDSYTSQAPIAHGAALGLGAVGILWDMDGDDFYQQSPDDETPMAQVSQGFGGNGGMGLLVDSAGNDTYSAPEALAQGVGLAPVFGLGLSTNDAAAGSFAYRVAGIGLLLDLGQGSDELEARAGQGHGDGVSTVGVLLDEQGATSYRVRSANAAYQGGRGSTMAFGEAGSGSFGVTIPGEQLGFFPGGLAALVDLGGDGDAYTTPPFPSAPGPIDSSRGRAFLASPGAESRAKQDNTLWANWTRTASIGIDSSLSDEGDGDGFPALAELLAGSDPNDPDDTPAESLPRQTGTVVAAVQGVIALVQGLDPGSFVPQQAPGTLFDLPMFCPGEDQAKCGGDGDSCDRAQGHDCVSLLFIGDATATTHAHRALLQVDLDGDDLYPTEVAGSPSLWVRGVARQFGSTSIDLDGEDRYETPTRARTQAFAAGGTSATGGIASLLLDLGGGDHYLATRDSQASAIGYGVAMLVDFGGDDTYSGEGGSQAAHIGQGWAALLDLGGNDDYRFVTQAASAKSTIGPAAVTGALFLDAAGKDHYNSTGIEADLDATQGATVFAAQGRIDASTAGNSQQVAAFIDIGDAEDLYETLTVDGGFEDVSALKNGVGVHANRPNATSDSAAAYFVDGAAALVGDEDGDHVPLLAEIVVGFDTDLSAQALPGGSPTSGNLTVTPHGDLAGRVTRLGYLVLPGMVLGSDLDNTYRDYVPFIVDLGGDDEYLAPSIGGTLAGYASRAVDTNVGTQVQLGTVAVLLDVKGDDTYHPAACARTVSGPGLATFESTQPHNQYGSGSVLTPEATQPPLESPLYTFCPSLGGTAAGVAILADGGGENDFRSSTWVNATSTLDTVDRTATVVSWGVTQGSAAFSGVGILATWDGRDSFSADLHVRAEETDLLQTPSATANGLAQGAAWGFATGILASFGVQDDDYSSMASATAPRTGGTDGGLARGFSQGAALAGNGILLDDGGRNTYSAPEGYSQGFATLYEVLVPSTLEAPNARGNATPFGVLWSGPGDDRYLGGDASQGAAGFGIQGAHSAGVLLDGGGNDVYTIGPAADLLKLRASSCPGPRSAGPQCALSQGAALLAGVGLLADLAGSDRYEAVGRTHVQASSLGGSARLVDLGGDDVYRAGSQAQGYANMKVGAPIATVTPPPLPAGPVFNPVRPFYPGPTPVHGNAPASALLFDLNGRDAYTLPSAGQGHVPPGSEANARAAFIDGGGHDRYRYGGTKTAVSGTPDNGNNWTWASAAPTAGPQNTTGIDTNAVEQALAALRSATAPTPAGPLPDFGSITLDLTRNPDGTSPVGEAATVKGTVYAFVNVSSEDSLRVQRVDILRDGEFLAVAEPLGPDRFRFEWRTVEPGVGVPDGATSLVATAFLTPAEGPGRFAAAPDSVEIESRARSVVVDNPPVASIVLRTDSPVAGQMVPGRHNATLEVTVGRDSTFPPGQQHNQGDLPGAYVDVTLRPLSAQSGVEPGTVYGFPRRYVVANTTAIRLDGSCPGSGTQWCLDGRYAVNVTVTDLAGQAAPLAEVPLLLDRTAPSSELADGMPLLPEYANRTHQAGLFGLTVGWTSTDGDSGLGPGDVSGVRAFDPDPARSGVVVLRLNATGAILGSPHLAGAGAASFPLQDPPIVSGDTVYLLTVAQDALGNRESPCDPASGGQPAEPEPCYRHKARQGAVKAVPVDFSLPIVRDVEADKAIARPGDSVTVSANVSDTAAGLRAVQLRRTIDNEPLPAIDLGLGAGEGRTATFLMPAAEGKEQRLDFEVWAEDGAGNTNAAGGTVIIDSMLPSFEGETVAYRDGATAAAAGRPGGRAFVSVDVHDREVATVNFTAPSLHIGKPVACTTGAGAAWVCTVLIPANATPGAHDVEVLAMDGAGNLNEARVGLEVVKEPPEVLDARVSDFGSDFIEVTWDTSTEATSHLRFGKTGDMRETAVGAAGLSLHHVVRVDGLLSGTKYFLRPEPHGPSNVENTTAEALQQATLPGYLLGLPAFDGTEPWSGVRDLVVGIEALGQSRAPVSLSVRLQSASGVVQEAVGLTAAPGVHTVAVDTTAFADGIYRINLTATREGSDRSSIASEPFRIDNTAPVLVASTPRPGGVSAQARPHVSLVVIDPLNPSLPPLDSLSVTLNGALVEPMNAGYTFVNGQRILGFDIEKSLPSGHHELTARLKDAAGNNGEVTWGFRVDGQAPDLHEAKVAYEPGPVSGKPGGDAKVAVKLADGTGVAAVRVDLGPAGGAPVPLAAMGGTRWNGTLRLPAASPAGELLLPILAVDGLGNAGQVGQLRLVVDGAAPRALDVWAVPLNLTAASVTVSTDEPTIAEASALGAAAAKSPGWDLAHTLTVSGLRPGQVANLTLALTDGAGNVNRITVPVTLASDKAPPTAPRRLQANSPAEGLVEVSWSAAADNAGVERYEVVRKVGNETVAFPALNGTATALTDATAPAGRAATYEVRAVDVAGLRGPAATVPVKVLALPRLSAPSIEPRSGPSDQPFHVEVEYAHPAGVAPESILLRYGDRAFPLLRSGPAETCEVACIYAADVLLPPRSTLRAAPAASILAEADGEAAVATLEAPLVTASGDELGVEAGGRDSPGPAVALAALALLAAARSFRRRPS